MSERAELQARSHVPLFHTNSIGCHYIDLDGYPWSTFTIHVFGSQLTEADLAAESGVGAAFFRPEPHFESCDLCGRSIMSGYHSPYGPAHLCVGCGLHTGECMYCLDCGATYLWWLADGPAPEIVSKPWDEKHMPMPLRMVAAHCDLCGGQLARSWIIRAHRIWERGARPINFGQRYTRHTWQGRAHEGQE